MVVNVMYMYLDLKMLRFLYWKKKTKKNTQVRILRVTHEMQYL